MKTLLSLIVAIIFTNVSFAQSNNTVPKNINGAPNYGYQHIGDKYYKTYNYYSNKKKSFKETNYIQGIHIKNKVLKSSKYLIIKIGGGLEDNIPIKWLKNGSDYKSGALVTTDNGTPFNLVFGIKNNVLLISAEFKDIDGKYVGKITHNQWELRPQKIAYYHDGKDNFEIIDDNKYVLFNMRYVVPNTIIINGYYYGEYQIQVADDSTLNSCALDNPTCKESMIKLIKKIKPLNKY